MNCLEISITKIPKRFCATRLSRLIAVSEAFFEEHLSQPMQQLIGQNDSLQRLYMLAQMQMQPDKRFYPDANFSLRVTYGNVDGFHPADAVYYNYYTTLDGIMEKEDPNIYDYVVEDKLKTLYKKSRFWSV